MTDKRITTNRCDNCEIADVPLLKLKVTQLCTWRLKMDEEVKRLNDARTALELKTEKRVTAVLVVLCINLLAVVITLIKVSLAGG